MIKTDQDLTKTLYNYTEHIRLYHSIIFVFCVFNSRNPAFGLVSRIFLTFHLLIGHGRVREKIKSKNVNTSKSFG